MRLGTSETMKRTIGILAIAFVIAILAGCGSGADSSTPIAPAPAATGPGGVPQLSDEQMKALPPDQQVQMKKAQEAAAAAASANLQRHDNPGGKMPSGG
jgi:hypothetical protein